MNFTIIPDSLRMYAKGEILINKLLISVTFIYLTKMRELFECVQIIEGPICMLILQP